MIRTVLRPRQSSSQHLTRSYGIMSNHFSITSTPNAPSAIGPYSQAIVTANNASLVFASGQIGLNLEGALVSGGIEAETDQALTNLANVLEASGCNMSDVVKTTVLLTTMENFAKVNTLYMKHFGNHKPARACYAVAGLPKGALVEIEAVAAVPPKQNL